MGNYYTVLDTLKTNLENDPFVNTVTQGDIFGVDLAKPCKQCQALIEKHGIKNVIYSGDTNGSISFKEAQNRRIAV